MPENKWKIVHWDSKLQRGQNQNLPGWPRTGCRASGVSKNKPTS